MRKSLLTVLILLLMPIALAADIICQKTYPYHLQGVATDGTSLYWSFSDWLVKTDTRGNVISEIKTVMHSGDLCVTGGKVYIATEEGLYTRESDFKEEIRVYDAVTLAHERTFEVPALTNGCSAIAYANGRFYVAAGIPDSLKDKCTRNEVYEYTEDFKLVKVHAMETGFTEYGIQTICFARNRFYLGFYGSASVPTGTFVASPDFSSWRRYNGDTSYGILELNGKLYRALTAKEKDAKWSGTLTVYDDPAGTVMTLPITSSSGAAVQQTSAPSSLTALGFYPSSYLLTGGAIDAVLSGRMNVQVNDAPSGGGVVTLENAGNTFEGGIHVASGTLAVPATVATGHRASVLGSGTAPIALGPATLHVKGDIETDRDLIFLPDAGKPKGASIVRVDEGVSARFCGRVSTADGKKGNFMKTGSGTLVAATPYSNAENSFGIKGSTPGWVGVNTAPPSFVANGDGPTSGFEAFNLIDGWFEIATGPTVTNHFPSETWIGMSSTTAAGAETAGHLVLKSGITLFDSLCIGRHNGTTVTAPDGLTSSVDVYGGDATVIGTLNMGYGDDAKFTHRPELRVHGGKMTIKGNWRMDHNWSYGKAVVDGGELIAESDIRNQNYGTGGAQLHIEVSGAGRFTSKGTLLAARASTAERKTVCRISVRDGGVFAAKSITSADTSDTQMLVDGATFKSIQKAYGDAVQLGAVYVGPKGMTLDVTDAYAWGANWTAPLRPVPGESDGGIDIVGKCSDAPHWTGCRVRLATDDITIKGGIRVHNAGISLAGGDYKVPFAVFGDSLVHNYGISAVDSLDCSGARLFLNYGYTGLGGAVTNLPMLTARAFVPPAGTTSVLLYNGDGTTFTAISGTWDVFAFPSSVDYHAKDFVLSKNSTSTAKAYLFAERTQNGMRIISLTVADISGNVAVGDDPRESDSWQAGTSPWTIGPWLFAYRGETLSTAAPLTLVLPRDRMAGISVPEGTDLTLTGGLYSMSGGFAKLGAGTLTLAGEAPYIFSSQFSTTAALDSNLANLALFDGSTNGAPSLYTHGAALTAGCGTLTLGTGSDNPSLTVPVSSFDVGTMTTSAEGEEGDAAFVLNSGRLTVAEGTMTIGRSHGTDVTSMKSPLVSSYVQNGGTADVFNVVAGYDNTFASEMDVRFTLNDGLFNCRKHFYVGNQDSRSTKPLTITFLQTGGRLSVGEDARRQADAGCSNGTEGRLIVKNNGNNDHFKANYTMTGGEACFWDGFSCYNKGANTVELKGGVIDFWDTFNGGDGTTLKWNGTVLVPHPSVSGAAPYLVRYFAKVYCDTEAIVDVTHCRSVDLLQAPTGAGRIVVRGSNTNNVLRIPAATYSLGGVTVEKGGVLVSLGSGEKAPKDVLVKDGGAVLTYYSTVLPSLTLGESADDCVVVYGYDMVRSLYRLTAEKLAINAGTVYVSHFDPITSEPVAYGGTQVYLRGPKGSIDPTKFALHPVLTARGMKAVFSVNTADATYDELVGTVDGKAHTWTAPGAGNWFAVSNWDVPPSGSVHDTVIFPATLAADATVSLGAGAHAWNINHEGSGRLTLDGTLTFDGAAEFNIKKPDGVLELSGDVKMGGDVNSPNTQTVTSRGTSGRGTLRVTGRISDERKMTLDVRSGRVEGRPEAFGAASLKLNNTTLRFTDSGVCRAAVSGDGYGTAIDVPANKTVYMTGTPNVATPFVKLGEGTVVFRKSGLLGKSQKSAATYSPVPANGDVPNASGFSICAGKLVLDGADSVYTSDPATYGLAVGFHVTPDGYGGAIPAVLEIDGGAQLISNSGLHLGCYGNEKVGITYDSPVTLGLTRRPRFDVNVRNGLMSVASALINYNNYSYHGCMIASLNVWEGGTFEVTTGRFAVCHDGDDVQLAEGESMAVVNLYGGLIDLKGDQGVTVNYYSSKRKYPARGIINIHGGLFRTKSEHNVRLMMGHGHGTLNMYGGVLETGFINTEKNYDKAQGDVHFDGGTFRPLQSGKTLNNFTTFTVGPGGATFDLSKANALTLGQTLTADGERTGGITLDAGSNAAAVLTLAAANDFGGALTVTGGRMVTLVPAAASCATGVVVNASGVFDANTYNYTFHTLAGEGGVYSNGTVTVTERVAPGNTTFTVEDLVLADGAVLSCPVACSEAGIWSAPWLTVSKSCAKQGVAYLDMGRPADDPLPRGTSIKVAELAQGVVFPRLDGIGAGDPGTVLSFRRVHREDGMTEVWASPVAAGLKIVVR